MRTAYFIIPPGVQLLDVTGPAHIFYEAGEYGAEVELIYVSMSQDDTHSFSTAGLHFQKLVSFQYCQPSTQDWIFVPGLETSLVDDAAFVQAHKPFFDWLLTNSDNAIKVCSVCTGAYLLGLAGLLENRSCTTHWKYIDHFQHRFPSAEVLDDRLFVKSGNIYSSAGVSSGIDLALFLLDEAYGPLFATKVAKEVVVFLRRSESDPQLSVFLKFRNHIDNRIHEVQDFIAQHLESKNSVDELAEHVHMSPRNLTRSFKKATGITIGGYLEKLRLERAVYLLSEGQKVDAVAASIGLSSNQLRSLLTQNQLGLPSQMSRS